MPRSHFKSATTAEGSLRTSDLSGYARSAAGEPHQPITEGFPDPLHLFHSTYYKIMQILPLRITPIIATACFAFAIPAAFADQNIGTPNGTITVTTPDTTLVPWGPKEKPHHQMRADQTYTADSSAWYVNGAFDPHASLNIVRCFQTGTQGTQSLGPMSEIMQGNDKPANSGFNRAQCNQTYGPFYPEQSNYVKKNQNGAVTNANAVCGVETILLVVYDAQNNPTVLDYEKIDIYEPKQSNAANFYVQNFLNKTALNTDTTKAYLGDPPRVTLTASPIYSGANVWVVIYPGNAQATPPANAKTIDNTTFNAPTGYASSYPSRYIDLGQNYINGSGIYTLQVMQESDSNFGTEAYGNPASFSINNNYNVTSQLGLVK
jgi:hypothetical protein